MSPITPICTSRKVLTISYQTPLEELKAADTLPTTEPGTPQISYTVAEAHLPTLNMPVYKKTFFAVLFGAGQVTKAATIYCHLKKNATSVVQSNYPVEANAYYTWTCGCSPVQVGDVLELALWSNQTDSNWDYKAYQIQMKHLIPYYKLRFLSVNFGGLTKFPNLTLGNPETYMSKGAIIYHLDKNFEDPLEAAEDFVVLYPEDDFGLYEDGLTEGVTAALLPTAHASYRPYFVANILPTQITFRGIRID